MSNPTALTHLGGEFMDVDEEIKRVEELRRNPPRKARGKKAAPKSPSDDATPPSRNELSEILSKLSFGKPSLSVSETPSNSKTRDPTEVRQAHHLLSQIQRYTDKMSNNILLYVKYITSPLRLYLKTTLQMMSVGDRKALAATIKVSDSVKDDLVGDWTAKDTFGLKLLVKMYRMYMNVLPMLSNHDDFMLYMKPNHGVDPEIRQKVTFNLYNYVMNPGPGLEIDMHGYFDAFLNAEAEEIAAVGFDAKDFRDQLRNKLAFELNLYASVVFKKQTKFKYEGAHGPVEEKHNPEDLMRILHDKFASFPGAEVFAAQMVEWMAVDDDMSNPARGYRGGAKKKAAKKTKKH